MKNLFLLFFVFLIYKGYTQFTDVPDPAFENFLENNGMGDGIPNNGQVLTANIENVTNLDLPSFAGISDMTGIEDFAAIEFLDFSYNNVTNIDLSQNWNLKIFGCAFNQMTSLNLTNNINLEWLVCQVNSISNIQLNSPVLHTLECHENQLISLDLSQCLALTWLDCHTNSIAELNITNCNNLTHLSAWDNQLTEIDISQNINLSYLHLSYNYNLSNLETIGNTLLTQLGCIHTNISSLDLVNNINLTHITCFDNPLTYIDIRNGNNESITTFNATNTDLVCIFVDDASATYLENWLIDATSTFVNNEAECDALSVSYFQEITKTIKLFPNPIKDYVAISIMEQAVYKLMDSAGKIMHYGHLLNGLNSLNLQDLPNGIYTLQLEFKTDVISKKIIKTE